MATNIESNQERSNEHLNAPGFFFKYSKDAVDFLFHVQEFANVTGSEKECAEKILLKLNLQEPLEITPIRNGNK